MWAATFTNRGNMAKLTLNDITSRYGAVDALNANFTAIEQAIENTLSRDGTIPNEMEAPLDMNSNPILNASTVYAGSLVLGGQTVEPGNAVAAATVQVFEFNATAGQVSFSVSPLTPTTDGIIMEVNGLVLPRSSISAVGSTLTFSPLALNDEVVVRVFTRDIGTIPDGAVTLADLSNTSLPTKGAALVGLYDGKAPLYAKTVSDILNFGDVSLLRFIPQNLHAAILNGTSVVDISDYWQEAIDALSTGGDTVTGGTLRLHRGRWCIGKKVIARTGNVAPLTSLNIVGDGMHNTQVYALTGFVGSSMLEMLEPTYCKVEGLHLFGAYNSITGLAVLEGSEITVRDVFAQQQTGPGMVFTNNFMVVLERLRAKTSTVGFQFNGPHTSINARNLYALDNALAGFYINDITYAHFDSCGSDTNREGYLVNVAQGLKFTACGAEQNVRSGWHFEASAAANSTSANCDNIGATLEECFSVGNNTGAGYSSSIYTSQLDTAKVSLQINGFREANTTGVSVLMANSTNDHVVRVDRSSVFLGSISGAASATGYKPAMRSGSATYNPPSLADGAGTTTTVAVPGVRFGDFCQASFSANVEGIIVTAYVSATDTVTVRFQNETAGIVDLASGTLSVLVIPQG